jgi:predicted MPP superfamily phosphohydrolase
MIPFSLLGRRRFLQLGAAFCLGCTGVAFYSSRIEPHWLEVVHRDMPIAHLPDALIGETLVQLSDLHVGHEVDDDFLLSAFDIVNRLEPAFVVVTGDFMTCDRNEQIDHTLRIVEHLRHGRLGTLAVLGNHDYGSSARLDDVAEQLTRGVRDLGIDVLRNEQRTVAGLTFVGIEDFWGPFFAPRRALVGLNHHGAHLALCHNPDGVDRPGWGEYQGWILAGHTHGGQCRPPFMRPPCLPVVNPRYVAGEIDLEDGRRLYINRALGHLRRLRFNVRPEITVFHLTRA